MRAMTVFLTFILALFILTACGGGDEDTAPPSTIIVASPTPRSTPLPPVNTPVFYGSTDLPLRVLYIPPTGASNVTDAEISVSEALNTNLTNIRLEELGLTMQVQLEPVENMLAALDAVCIQRDALAWVDAFTYAAAVERCDAQPLLGVQREISINGLPDGVEVSTQDGIQIEIIYRADLSTPPQNITELAGLTFCRLSRLDAISWVYLGLALQAEGVNPLLDLGGVVDVEDYSAMLSALDDGTCDVGAIPSGTLAALIEATDGVTEDEILILSSTIPTIPHDILIAPPDESIPPDIIQSFVSQLLSLQGDDDFSDALQLLIPYDQIIEVRALDFRRFLSWLDDAGWAMDQ